MTSPVGLDSSEYPHPGKIAIVRPGPPRRSRSGLSGPARQVARRDATSGGPLSGACGAAAAPHSSQLMSTLAPPLGRALIHWLVWSPRWLASGRAFFTRLIAYTLSVIPRHTGQQMPLGLLRAPLIRQASL